MAYTVYNFKRKKDLREAVAHGLIVPVYQPGPFGPDVPDGEVSIEGPHFPAAHRWYSRVQVLNGCIAPDSKVR